MDGMIVGSAIGSSHWRERADNAISVAKRAASNVSGRANYHFKILALTKDLWSLDNKLRGFLEGIYLAVESGKPSGNPPESPSETQIREATAALRNAFNLIDNMYGVAKAKGLTNQAFTGAALNSVRMRADEILDIVESVELALNPKAVEPVFEKALHELRTGEAFDLADFR